jgi:hypothetical protein
LKRFLFETRAAFGFLLLGEGQPLTSVAPRRRGSKEPGKIGGRFYGL